MKLAAAMYLANDGNMGYPIGPVLQSLVGFVDEVYCYAGDAPSIASFARERRVELPMQIISIDHPITTVGDIPAMMTRVMREVQRVADFVLLVQCDTMATDESKSLVRQHMVDANRTLGAHLYTRIGLLYHDSGTGWGHTLVGNQFGGRFDGDGIGYDGAGNHIGFIGDIDSMCLEIGSLSVHHYARHRKQHMITWNERALMGDRCDAYDRGDLDTFLRLSLRDARNRIINRPLVPVEQVDARYTAVIDAMGLRDECEQLKQFVIREGFDK